MARARNSKALLVIEAAKEISQPNKLKAVKQTIQGCFEVETPEDAQSCFAAPRGDRAVLLEADPVTFNAVATLRQQSDLTRP